MNNNRQSESDNLRSLQILDELSKNNSLTQRDLSKNLGIALGLVNSYIKNLIKKGYLTITSIPPKRYAYYLTPKGFSEKTRLTYNLLQDYNRIYREARTNLKKVFEEIRVGGARHVVFAGVDEVAEIAYITLQETDMKLLAVVDDPDVEKRFLELKVLDYENLKNIDYDCVMVTTHARRGAVHKKLLKSGVPEEKIKVIFS